jgi:putative SOS response-associated peptidase YedK
MINARVETVTDKPAFKRAFERYRCLIIADGFYEWRKPDPEHPRKQPFHITKDDGGLFAFAGLWSIWYAPDDSKLRTCTILTTRANGAIEQLHDRMPIILAPEHEQAWLDTATPPEQLTEILSGLTAEHTRLRPVGTAVNDARYDGPDCLAPPAEDPQTSLF